MGVYNGEETLRETVQSIIAQTINDREFIAVDDADFAPQILESCAVQNRVLTHAIISGCKVARGKFVVSQDNGDFAFRMQCLSCY